ncbi:MAG: GDP-mannose 4,6-dehydratase [Candidatus Staskawiczbacteria bacterium]|nr:GDP-mannose 4,6-dehydratase [Candidatus Staskawiczbacteria bacterium]
MENMEITKKKILVTGGAGFIGSNLVNELLAKNNKVIVIDDLSSGSKENVNKKAKFYKLDVKKKKVFEIIKKEKPEIVFHFAAQPIVQIAYDNPYNTLETNIIGTLNILEACRQQKGVESIIIVSSDKAYGKSEILPYKEGFPLSGDHPYDVSKSATDLIAQAYFKTYNLPILITRFSNVFGPADRNFSRIIPGVLKSIINKKEFLVRSNGKMVREYTYVNDIVDGCIKLASTKENFGQAFNFGSQNIFNVIEIIEKIEKILGVKVNYKVLNIAKNEIPAQYLDWTKAKEKLGWQPKTSFEDGVKATLEWCKKLNFHE